MKFLIRQNVEYTLLVEAKNAEEALVLAELIPLDQYESAFAPPEAEEYPEDPPNKTG